MPKLNLNSKGFAPIAAVLAVVVLVVIVGGGAYVYHNNHKAKTVSDSTSTSSTSKTSKTSTNDKTASTADPYAGWKTYSMGSTGLTVKYPATWTAANGAAQCDGSQGYTIKPAASELASVGISSVNEQLTSYEVGITVEPKQSTSTNCAPGGSLQGIPVGSLGNSQVITSGALKGKYFLVTGDAAHGTSQSFVVDNNYNANQSINESGLLSVNGLSVGVGASFTSGQDIGDADINSFVGSQLYKDTVDILNSVSAN